MIALLRNLVVHDFWLKLFSLALAVLIWVTLSIAKEGGLGNRSGEEIFHIPVRVMSSSSDASGFHANPEQVKVKIRGLVRKLEDLQPGDIRALVEVSGPEPARGSRKRVSITTLEDLTIVEIVPPEVEVVAPTPH